MTRERPKAHGGTNEGPRKQGRTGFAVHSAKKADSGLERSLAEENVTIGYEREHAVLLARRKKTRLFARVSTEI